MARPADASRDRYTTIQIAFHWIIAVLLTVNWFLGEGMGRLFDSKFEEAAAIDTPIHVWLGLVILAAVTVRLILRAVHGHPPAPASGGTVVRAAGIWSHRVLYLLMLAVPLLGIIAWYGGFEWSAETHTLAVDALLVVVGLHTAAALVHQFVWKDGLLMRMVRPAG